MSKGGTAIAGTEKVVVSLSRQFAMSGWSVQTTFPRTPAEQTVLQYCEDEGIKAETTEALIDIYEQHQSLHDLLSLRRYIRAKVPSIVNIHFGGSFISLKDVLSIRLAGRNRCIVTVNHPDPWNETNQRKRQMTKIAGHLAHAVVVISKATRQVMIEAGIPASKLHIIPCGIQVPEQLTSRSEARHRLGLPAEAFIISAVARLAPYKAIDVLIKAVAQIPDRNKNLFVVVGGEGPARDSLERLASECLKDRAVFLGRIPDTHDLYAASDLFVLPSQMEGLGLVYIEAGLHSIPSIGTHAGGTPEAILDGQTGRLISVGDVNALAVAIRELSDDDELRHRLGQGARVHARTNFTEERMASQYRQLFLSLL